MSYTVKGSIKMIGETEQVSDSFKKREFVVVDKSGKYEQTILFQTVQDNCSLLDNLKLGYNVEVHFNLNGREWTSPKDGKVRYFNSLDAWKIDTRSPEATPIEAEGDDDLPF